MSLPGLALAAKLGLAGLLVGIASAGLLAGLAPPALAQAQPAADPALAEAQQVLLMMGLNPGKPDGLATPRSTAAISEFQKRQNLPATGKADSRTLDALRQVRDSKFSGTLGGPPPKGQAPRARTNMVEGPAVAMPTAPVTAESLDAPEGIANTSPSASVPPPSLFGGGRSTVSAAPIGSSTQAAGDPAEGDWLWAIPAALVPLFLGLLAWGLYNASHPPPLFGERMRGGRRDPQI